MMMRALAPTICPTVIGAAPPAARRFGPAQDSSFTILPFAPRRPRQAIAVYRGRLMGLFALTGSPLAPAHHVARGLLPAAYSCADALTLSIRVEAPRAVRSAADLHP